MKLKFGGLQGEMVLVFDDLVGLYGGCLVWGFVSLIVLVRRGR